MSQAETKIAEAAVIQANQQARELLSDTLLTQLLPNLSKDETHILRKEWVPFKVYRDGQGAGLQFAPDSDALTRKLMSDDSLYLRLEEIGNQALLEHTITGASLTTMLKELYDFTR